MVLPAFHSAARGQGWVSPAIPQEGSLRFMNLAHAGVEPATSSRGRARFWKPCCGMPGQWAGRQAQTRAEPARVWPLWAPDLGGTAVREPQRHLTAAGCGGGAAEVLAWLNSLLDRRGGHLVPLCEGWEGGSGLPQRGPKEAVWLW